MEQPEKRDVQERLTVQRRIDETVSGEREIDIYTYPYFNPDYKIPFLHIGTEKQLFLDNYILEHLEDVEREICRPQKHPEPLLATSESSDSRIFGSISAVALILLGSPKGIAAVVMSPPSPSARRLSVVIRIGSSPGPRSRVMELA